MNQCISWFSLHNNRVISKHWFWNQLEWELGDILKRSHIFPLKYPVILRILENKEETKGRGHIRILFVPYWFGALSVVMGSEESSTISLD